MNASTKQINGKVYRMWGSLVDAKEKFIGGVLTDVEAEATTEITDLTLEPCGEDSAVFEMHGKEFNCSVNVKYGGLTARDDGKRGFEIAGYSMRFLIEPKPVAVLLDSEQ